MEGLVRLLMLLLIAIVFLYYLFLLGVILCVVYGKHVMTPHIKKKCCVTLCYLAVLGIVAGMYFYHFDMDIIVWILIVTVFIMSVVGKNILTFSDITNIKDNKV